MDQQSNPLFALAERSYLQGRYDTLDALYESLKEAFAKIPNPITNGILDVLEINKLETSLKLGALNE